MAEKVSIVIDATDNASKVLQRTADMTNEVAKALTNLVVQERNNKILAEAKQRFKDLTETEKKTALAAYDLAEAQNKAAMEAEEFNRAQNTSSMTWTELKSKIDLVTQALGQVYRVIKGNIDQYSGYVESVDKMSMATGMASDETSRLIQLADDFRVDQGALTTAMRMALKNGFNPTVENLAKLSDEYLGMTSATERAEMMQKKFGRGWFEMVPLLERGGTAIRAAADSIGDGLVVTEEAVKQNREYQKAVDDLSDSWTAFKYSKTKDAIPALTSWMQMNVQANELIDQGVGRLELQEIMTRRKALADLEAGDAMMAYAARYAEQAESVKTTNETVLDPSLEETTEVTAQAASRLSDLPPHLRGIANAAKESARSAQDMASASKRLEEAETTLRQAEDAWASREGGDIAAMLDENKLGSDNYKDGLRVLDEVMGTNKVTEYELQTAQQELTDEYNTGKITLDEFKQGLIDVKDQFMPLDESVKSSTELVAKFHEQWDALQSKTIILKVVTQGDGSGIGEIEKRLGRDLNGNGTIGAKNGLNFTVPPGYPNDSFYLPLSVTSGERVTVTPANTTNYNLTINEAGSRGNVVSDFGLLKALAGA